MLYHQRIHFAALVVAIVAIATFTVPPVTASMPDQTNSYRVANLLINRDVRIKVVAETKDKHLLDDKLYELDRECIKDGACPDESRCSHKIAKAMFRACANHLIVQCKEVKKHLYVWKTIRNCPEEHPTLRTVDGKTFSHIDNEARCRYVGVTIVEAQCLSGPGFANVLANELAISKTLPASNTPQVPKQMQILDDDLKALRLRSEDSSATSSDQSSGNQSSLSSKAKHPLPIVMGAKPPSKRDPQKLPHDKPTDQRDKSTGKPEDWLVRRRPSRIFQPGSELVDDIEEELQRLDSTGSLVGKQ